MNNPIELLEKWFSALPADARKDLSFLAVHAIPNSPYTTGGNITRDPEELFLNWIKDVMKLFPSRLIGHVLSMRSIIDFFVMRSRGSKESWDKITSINIRMIEAAENEGQPETFVEPLKKIVREAQFRQKQWDKIASSWKELCSGALSDDALETWLDNNMVLQSMKDKFKV